MIRYLKSTTLLDMWRSLADPNSKLMVVPPEAVTRHTPESAKQLGAEAFRSGSLCAPPQFHFGPPPCNYMQRLWREGWHGAQLESITSPRPRRWWVSWVWQIGEGVIRRRFVGINAIWKHNYVDATHFHAAIIAPTEEAVWRQIEQACMCFPITSRQKRFCLERPDDWTPFSKEFPQEEGMHFP